MPAIAANASGRAAVTKALTRRRLQRTDEPKPGRCPIKARRAAQTAGGDPTWPIPAWEWARVAVLRDPGTTATGVLSRPYWGPVPPVPDPSTARTGPE